MILKRYFFPSYVVGRLSYPPKNKLCFTGLWNKNGMRYEWFFKFRKHHSRLGYTAYRLTRCDYWRLFIDL